MANDDYLESKIATQWEMDQHHCQSPHMSIRPSLRNQPIDGKVPSILISYLFRLWEENRILLRHLPLADTSIDHRDNFSFSHTKPVRRIRKVTIIDSSCIEKMNRSLTEIDPCTAGKLRRALVIVSTPSSEYNTAELYEESLRQIAKRLNSSSAAQVSLIRQFRLGKGECEAEIWQVSD